MTALEVKGLKLLLTVMCVCVIEAATSTAPEIFYCEDCHINFNSQNQLVQHLTSPKHMNRVNRPQRQQVTGMFRGMARGRGHGQGRGRGRGRGGKQNGQSYCLLKVLLHFSLDKWSHKSTQHGNLR